MSKKIKVFLKPDVRVMLYAKNIKNADIARQCHTRRARDGAIRELDPASMSRILHGNQCATQKVIDTIAKELDLPRECLYEVVRGIPEIIPNKANESVEEKIAVSG